MGFGLYKHLSAEERAEYSERLFRVRDDLTRLTELMEKSAKAGGVKEEAAIYVESMQQLIKAMQILFTTPEKLEVIGKMLNAARDISSEIIGPGAGVPPHTDRAPMDGEEWDDTLKE